VGDLRKVPVMGGTNLRLGGSTQGEPDNAIGSIPAGNYTAIAQAAGQRVWDDQHRNTNFWWVLIDTPRGPGWVSAVRITEGGNDEKIRGVETIATVFEAPVPAGPHRSVPIVPGGGRIRRGGSTLGQPDNVVAGIGGGVTYPALVQSAGEAVVIDRAENFWWVLIDTPQGRGWINAVLINEGGNNQKIDRVPTARTVFGRPHGVA
jgi:hypothetical protein